MVGTPRCGVRAPSLKERRFTDCRSCVAASLLATPKPGEGGCETPGRSDAATTLRIAKRLQKRQQRLVRKYQQPHKLLSLIHQAGVRAAAGNAVAGENAGIHPAWFQVRYLRFRNPLRARLNL